MSTRFPFQLLIVAILVFCCFFHQASAQDRHQKFMDSLITVLPRQKEDSTKALLLINIARQKMGVAQNNGMWNEAIAWAQRSLTLSTKINYQWGIGRSNIMLGQCWIQKGNYAEASKHFYAALKLADNNGNKNLAVASRANLAGCYSHLGNYTEAIKYRLQAYEIVQQLNNNGPASLKQLASSIADDYVKSHRYEEALSWYNKTLPENPTDFYEGHILLQIADIQLQMKQYDEALKSFRNAVQIFPSRFKRKAEVETKGVLGEWFMEYGEAYLKIGILTKDSEQFSAYNEAIKHLSKSFDLLEKGTGSKEALLKVYDLLKQAYEAINDHQNALKYTKLYMGVRDSIYSKQAYLKMADVKIQFETEKAALAMKAQRELEQLEEAAFRDRILYNERLQQEKELAEEKLYHEKEISTQRLQKETAIADEKTRHEKAIAEQTALQEVMKAEKQRANNLLLMGLMLVAITSVFLLLLIRQRQAKKRAVEKAEAIRRMAELELQSLRAQLNPHFMFNSLNSIQELILMEENDKSHSYLARFSKLLRMLLENAEKAFVPLQKELDFLQLYLGLENLRVPDLQYSIYTDPSVDTEQTIIPNMILQPYIENAIWHGLSHKADDKQLRIRIFRENGTVNYEIEDNGVGRQKAAELQSLFQKQHKSKGMELLSKRFKLLNKEYSAEISTTIADVIKENEVAGTRVTIKLPVNTLAPLYN